MKDGIRRYFFENLGEIHYCEQCGRCSSVCPLTGIDGFNIRRVIRSIEMSRVDKLLEHSVIWDCLACRRCEDACPNGVRILSLIRYIRKSLPKKFYPVSPIPCIAACPLEIDIPGFIRLIASGKEDDALDLILQKTPIPGILGRICGHPCEKKCRRGKIDAPVSICSLKRYVSANDGDFVNEMYKPGKDTNKKVLIIGSGPAGLSAAYYLRRKGHSVTIVERKENIGGMLRYGIPSYRLPRSVLSIEINRIISMGIDVKTNVKLNNVTADLMKHNFDAVFLAIGLPLSSKISLNSISSGKIVTGVDFLAEANNNSDLKVGENVLVVGGGNVAVDSAMAAIRLGAKNVILACLESKDKMPANSSDVDLLLEEGGRLLNCWGPKEFSDSEDYVSVELMKCKSIFDKCGKFSPKFNSQKTLLNVSQVILAIGQTCDKESLREISGFIGENIDLVGDLINVDEMGSLVNINGVFAGGDAVNGSQSVVSAAASGRKIAASIDSFLGGSGDFWFDKSHTLVDFTEKSESNSGFSYLERQRNGKLEKDKRVHCFREINRGLDKNQVNVESSRCLSCDKEYYLVCK